MTGYMIEFHSGRGPWIKAGSVYLDRAEAEDTLNILSYCEGEHRVVEVPIRGTFDCSGDTTATFAPETA